MKEIFNNAAAAVLALYLIGAITVAHCAKLARLPTLPTLQIALDSPSTVIVAPGTARYPQVARRLAERMKASTGQAIRVVDGSIVPADVKNGPMIVLGNMMDCRVVRKHYFQAYDFTDRAWPGPGGHVVRTLRDPFGTGVHVVLLGGSDIEGVAAAAETFLPILAKQEPTLGYVNRVKLGRWAGEIRSYTEEFLSDDDSIWLRSGVSGSWDYQIQIARAGLGFLRTGVAVGHPQQGSVV